MIERPARQREEREPAYGSDVVAETLRGLGLEYISLNPGASYRGLHDSIVNYLGNERPQLILCLHEEHAVAVAHGYAKVTERPMAVALHSNVGLMHASMAIYNAFCDRVPLLALGATGPLDAAERRPWIDWIHTAADQAALVRPFVKWDDQPGSPAAAVESLVHAHQLTGAYPCAPVYVCLDASLQEAPLAGEGPALPALERFAPPSAVLPGEQEARRVLDLLHAAAHPLVLAGRVGRSEAAWRARVELAEALGARVLTDLKAGAAFPSAHPLSGTAPGTFLTREGAALVRDADAILALDWIDLGGTLRQAFGPEAVTPRIASCSLDYVLANGWSKDHFSSAPVDVHVSTHPDLLVQALLALAGTNRPGWEAPAVEPEAAAAEVAGIPMRSLAAALAAALGDGASCLVRLPLGFDGRDLRVSHPLDYLGQDGGAGLGSGPGMAVGAALALRGTGRLPVAVLGDGDVLMGGSALWTAAHYELPLLVVVANNRSFFNDEVHQERMAVQRSRPVENRWIGQRIADPEADLAGLARSLGLVAFGPVVDEAALADALATAVHAARGGASVLVDVHVGTRGYPGGPVGS